MLNLTGKVALVTGSSRGVGRAIALQLAEAGADIIVNFSDVRAAADETAGRIAGLGRRVAEVQADLSEPDDIATMLDWVGETFGRLDILVSNIVPRELGSLLSATPDEFDAVMHHNVRPLMLLSQAARSLMSQHGGGKVIAVSSHSQHSFSSTGRAALAETTERLALELGRDGISVNAIEVTGDAESLAQGAAGTALFLASGLSAHVQGQTIAVSGQCVGV